MSHFFGQFEGDCVYNEGIQLDTGVEMMYVCMECYELYNGVALNKRDFEIYDESKCPRLNCDGMVVEIDELIAPTIIILNQKGYMTEFCCSGHWYNKSTFKPYIKFVDKENTPEMIPDGWDFEGNCVIRYTDQTKFKSTIDQFSCVATLNQRILQWAIDLPKNSY